MSWPKRTIRGVNYDFVHLQPFVLKVPNVNPHSDPYKVRVQFGCHVFSKALEPADAPDLHVQDGSAVRCFCPIRHGQSRFLRGILRDAADKNVLISHSSNCCLLTPLPGLAGPYATFFDLRKAAARRLDVHLMVRSAYEKRYPPRMASIGFSVLIDSLLR